MSYARWHRDGARSPQRAEGPRERPGLQPRLDDAVTPEEALRVARATFAAAVPDPGRGYLVRKRLIAPEVARRFGEAAGKWAVLRYDELRDEVLIAHTNEAGRFVGYEYRGGVTRFNIKGSRGYASRCVVGLAVLGDWMQAKRLVLCESGIEALSLCELEGGPAETVYVSCSGGPKGVQMARVAAWAAEDDRIVATAYNADRAGDTFRAAARAALIEAGMEPSHISDLVPEVPGAGRVPRRGVGGRPRNGGGHRDGPG